MDTEKLSARQEAFCREYLIDLNGTAAAIRAGYSPKSARAIAAQNLTKLNIQVRIQAERENLEQLASVTKLRVLLEHMKIAFASLGSLQDTWMKKKDFEMLPSETKAIIQETLTKSTIRKTADGAQWRIDYIKVKLYDKQRALEAISKLMGYEAPLKNELTGKDGTPLFDTMSDAELLSQIDKLSKKLGYERTKKADSSNEGAG